jgi:hypothetical protein
VTSHGQLLGVSRHGPGREDMTRLKKIKELLIRYDSFENRSSFSVMSISHFQILPVFENIDFTRRRLDPDNSPSKKEGYAVPFSSAWASLLQQHSHVRALPRFYLVYRCSRKAHSRNVSLEWLRSLHPCLTLVGF